MPSNLSQDCRYAFRMMIKRPLFSLAIILTLGVCIGAVTTVFSAVDAAILRALPYPEPDRLAQLVLTSQYNGGVDLQVSQDGTTWQTFKATPKTFDVAVYSAGTTGVNFSSGNRVGYLLQQRVGAGFFRVLGVQPTLGREFTEEEERPGGPALMILSYDLWTRSFNANPSVIGQTAVVAGEPYEIVGVAAPSFHSTTNADIWIPLRPTTTGEGSGINYHIVARLHAGTTWPQAEAEAQSIGQTIIKQQQLGPGRSRYFSLTVLQDILTQDLKTPLTLILCGAVLVLLIGCVNVMGMLLARGAARGPEIATRMALGAGRASIVRQLLVENLALGLAAAIVGMALGYFGIEALKGQHLEWDILQSATLDIRVLAAMMGLSIVATMVFGIFPAIQAGRVDIRSAQSGRGIIGGSRSLLRRVLPAFQVAIAVFLLIGAALLIRSFAHLWQLDPGFEASNVITASFSLRDARYAAPEATNRLFTETLRRFRELSGVESAAVALTLPYERGLNMVLNKPSDGADVHRLANVIYASPDFFSELRIPLLRGRMIADSDGPDSTPVILINDAFARKHFPGEDPLGTQIRINDETRQIVGIVGNVQQQAGFGYGNAGPMGQAPSAYIPAFQLSKGYLAVHVWFSPKWIIRTHGAQGNLQQQIDETVRAVDPLLPIASFQTLNEVKSRAFAWNQFLAASLGLAAAIALILSSIGTYAMISNSVVERTREFGIRMALGATLAQTIRSAAMPGLISAAVGLIAGVIAARLETKLLQGLVWGVTTTDTATFLLVPVTVLIVAAVASIAPALRISGLDPAQTLRRE